MSSDVVNRNRLFLASFVTLLAHGIGFAVRGSILDDWGTQFGFTRSELGEISGMGLVGFGVTIIIFSTIADRIGYGRLMAVAFGLHVASAVVSLAATPLYAPHFLSTEPWGVTALEDQQLGGLIMWAPAAAVYLAAALTFAGRWLKSEQRLAT